MFTCRICGETGKHTEYETRETMLGLGDRVTYFCCAGCGCLQVAQIPADMVRYYPTDYYSLAGYSQDRPFLKALKTARDRYALFGTGLLGAMVDKAAPSIYMRGLRIQGLAPNWSILDVGCGAGRNTVSLGDAGLTDVTGVDPFIEKDIRYPNGVVIKKMALEQAAGVWDVLYFHHSFEHVPNPISVLRAAAERTSVRGVVVLSMPVVPCDAWERYGVNWIGLDPPRHLHIHSPKSVAVLAEQAGLHVERIVYNSNAMQFWGSEQNERGIGLFDAESRMARSRYCVSPVKALRWRREAARLNRAGRGDQAVFTLRRAG